MRYIAGFILGQSIFGAAVYLFHRLFFSTLLQQESYFVLLFLFSLLGGILGSCTANLLLQRSQSDTTSEVKNSYWLDSIAILIIFQAVLQAWVKIRHDIPNIGLQLALGWHLPWMLLLIIWSTTLLAWQHKLK